MGMVFVASAFSPVAAYHFLGEADVTGVVWNFMLPVGWFSLVLGFMIIVHQMMGMHTRTLGSLLVVGSLMMFLFNFIKADCILGFWTGTVGDFDTDNYLPITFWTAIIGIFVGLLLRFPAKNSKMGGK